MKRDETAFDPSGYTYHPATGEIWFGARRADYSDGLYRAVCRNNSRVLAHRLAWRLVNGEWPTAEVDHRNRNKHDNTWANLRAATSSQNHCNISLTRANRSGERGVFWDTWGNSWRVVVGFGGKRKLYYASSYPSAVCAARLIRRVLHGEFSVDASRPTPTA